MKRLAIIGAGDLGKLIAHHAVTDQQYEVAGFFDDTMAMGSMVAGKPTLGGINAIQTVYQMGMFDCLLIGIGYRHFEFRKELFEKFSAIIPFANLVHSSCYVDPSCQLGSGNVMLPGCVLDAHVRVADSVLLNTGVTIAHDSSIDSHSFLSPRVAVAGFVQIGSCCNIGINTTIIDNITIADGVQTGGGAVVTEDLLQKGLYIGIPAKPARS